MPNPTVPASDAANPPEQHAKAPPASLGRLHVLGQLGWLSGAVGAAVGIAVAGFVTALLLTTLGLSASSQAQALPWLVAPLGASAVLVFAVPASPLAQAWPLIGGNVLSACVGLLAGHLLAPDWLACALAVGIAVALMAALRCLHPPGGACALLCALGASGTDAWGAPYLVPIAANVLLLALCAWVYNRAVGKAWPHRPAPASAAPATAPVAASAGAIQPLYQRHDLEAVLDEWDRLLDVDRDDLDQLLQAVEERALTRQQKSPHI